MTNQTTPMKQGKRITIWNLRKGFADKVAQIVANNTGEINYQTGKIIDLFLEDISQLLLQKEQEVREEMQSEIGTAKEEERREIMKKLQSIQSWGTEFLDVRTEDNPIQTIVYKYEDIQSVIDSLK